MNIYKNIDFDKIDTDEECNEVIKYVDSSIIESTMAYSNLKISYTKNMLSYLISKLQYFLSNRKNKKDIAIFKLGQLYGTVKTLDLFLYKDMSNKLSEMNLVKLNSTIGLIDILKIIEKHGIIEYTDICNLVKLSITDINNALIIGQKLQLILYYEDLNIYRLSDFGRSVVKEYNLCN